MKNRGRWIGFSIDMIQLHVSIGGDAHATELARRSRGAKDDDAQRVEQFGSECFRRRTRYGHVESETGWMVRVPSVA